MDSGGPKQTTIIRWGPDSPWKDAMFRESGGPLQSIWNTVHVRRRCGLLSNYFDHLTRPRRRVTLLMCATPLSLRQSFTVSGEFRGLFWGAQRRMQRCNHFADGLLRIHRLLVTKSDPVLSQFRRLRCR